MYCWPVTLALHACNSALMATSRLTESRMNYNDGGYSRGQRRGESGSRPRVLGSAQAGGSVGAVRISVSNREAEKNHTIVLIQYTEDTTTRTFYDFESLPLALEGILKVYEQRLKILNPNVRNITYDIKDLYNYIDEVTDMSCLVFNSEVLAYKPYSKEWIKQNLLAHLKLLAQQ